MADSSAPRFREVGTVMGLPIGLQDALLVCKPEAVQVAAQFSYSY